MTQAKFAKLLGIPQSQYNRYETGRNSPPTDLIKKIAELKHVTIDWIMLGSHLDRHLYHDATTIASDDVRDQRPTWKHFDELQLMLYGRYVVKMAFLYRRIAVFCSEDRSIANCVVNINGELYEVDVRTVRKEKMGNSHIRIKGKANLLLALVVIEDGHDPRFYLVPSLELGKSGKRISTIAVPAYEFEKKMSTIVTF